MESVKNILEITDHAATTIGCVAIIFLFIQYIQSKDLRNLQLMHRCIDNYRKWSEHDNREYNYFYLELLNEELFYFQNKLIEKKVAIEWLDGIVDYIQIFAKDGTVLNCYNEQQDLEALVIWKNKMGFYERIRFFVHSSLDKTLIVPHFNDASHLEKKRGLAIELYKYIKNYKY
jgi:hypothetical protein